MNSLEKDYILKNYYFKYDGYYSPLLREDLEGILDKIRQKGGWEIFSEHFLKLEKMHSKRDSMKKLFGEVFVRFV